MGVPAYPPRRWLRERGVEKLEADDAGAVQARGNDHLEGLGLTRRDGLDAAGRRAAADPVEQILDGPEFARDGHAVDDLPGRPQDRDLGGRAHEPLPRRRARRRHGERLWRSNISVAGPVFGGMLMKTLSAALRDEHVAVGAPAGEPGAEIARARRVPPVTGRARLRRPS
jgi:hypothetical protein